MNPAGRSVGSLRPLLIVHLAALVLLPVFLPSVQLATEIVILSLAATSCQLLLCYGPLLSFAQGAFFGLGAYAGGLFAIHSYGTGWGSVLPVVAVGSLMGAAAGLAAGSIALRRVASSGVEGAGGVAFLMFTFAFAQLTYFTAYNLPGVTGGENGLLDVPRAALLPGVGLASPGSFYAFCAALLSLVLIAVEVLSGAVIGQAFKALQSNERRAAAVGYDPYKLRLALFTATGAMAGLAGALYSQFLGLAPLSVVELGQGQTLVICAILGGVSSPFGALLGTTFLVLGSDRMSQLWPHWKLLVGAAVMLVVIAGRGGLLGVLEALPWRRAQPMGRSG